MADERPVKKGIPPKHQKNAAMKRPPEDALVSVRLRNNFYRDSYRKLVLALIISFIIIGVLVATLAYYVTHPTKPTYFATTTDGRIINLVPLDRPNQSDQSVLQWATDAANAMNSYDFANYRRQLQDASQYFTENGWNSFLQALAKNNTIKLVTDNKLVVSSVVSQSPIIVEKGLAGNRYAWKIQMPVSITYQSANTIKPQRLLMTMTVMRVPTTDSPSGLGIVQIITSDNSAALRT